MTELASRGQLRASFLRWALVLAPGILLLGFLSGVVAGSGADNPWFEALIKPSAYPPAITFPIVWSLLYVLMGLALAVVVSARGAAGRGRAVALFVVQLLLNLAWSPLFFAAHRLGLALYLLAAIDVAVALTCALFWRIRPLAGVLLLPYLAWVLFATLLSWQLQALNQQENGDNGAAVRMRIAP